MGTQPTEKTLGKAQTQAAIRALADDQAFIEEVKRAVGVLPSGAIVTFTKPCSELDGWTAYVGKESLVGSSPLMTGTRAVKNLYVCEKD